MSGSGFLPEKQRLEAKGPISPHALLHLVESVPGDLLQNTRNQASIQKKKIEYAETVIHAETLSVQAALSAEVRVVFSLMCPLLRVDFFKIL